jgi:hypothetical protein
MSTSREDAIRHLAGHIEETRQLSGHLGQYREELQAHAQQMQRMRDEQRAPAEYCDREISRCLLEAERVELAAQAVSGTIDPLRTALETVQAGR